MKSVERPVFCVEPCPKLVVMPATLTPRPTCAGLVPPPSAVGAEPLRMTWDRVSSKTVWELLKPTVLTLAMLLPVTSSLVWWARRPEMAENIERSTGRSSQEGERGRGSGGGGHGDLGEAPEGHLLATDDGSGLVAGEADRGHRPRPGRAVFRGP